MLWCLQVYPALNRHTATDTDDALEKPQPQPLHHQRFRETATATTSPPTLPPLHTRISQHNTQGGLCHAHMQQPGACSVQSSKLFSPVAQGNQSDHVYIGVFHLYGNVTTEPGIPSVEGSAIFLTATPNTCAQHVRASCQSLRRPAPHTHCHLITHTRLLYNYTPLQRTRESMTVCLHVARHCACWWCGTKVVLALIKARST